MSDVTSLVILIAGPDRATYDDPDRLAIDLEQMESIALFLFRKGHVPVVGDWLAFPLVTLAGSRRPDDAVFAEVYHRMLERVVARCDAVLRVGGPSPLADAMIEAARGRGLAIFFALAEVPGTAGPMIDGAELMELASDRLRPRLTLLSADRARLATVTERPDSLFRVDIHERVTEPGYGGPFWGRAEDPSITSSLEEGRRIARMRLGLAEERGVERD